jgi:hypothetical protein
MSEKQEKPKELVTHNMWKIIMLMVHGHSPLLVEVGKLEGRKGGRDVLRYTFANDAQELSAAWDRGDDSPTMETVRKVKNVTEMFKENLRRRLG